MPLSPYCNPSITHERQPRCFPLQAERFLASFANMVSSSDNTEVAAGGSCVCPKSTIPTQGRLLCTQRYVGGLTKFRTFAPQYRFHPASYRVSRALLTGASIGVRHNGGSPRKQGRELHAIASRPETLTPSIHPNLGERSKHQGLHRCALQRIFRPVLGIDCSD